MTHKVKVKKYVLYKTIGEEIYLARKRKGMTQDQLEEETGLDRAYISQIENGYRNISITSALKISRALKIDIKKLLGEKTRKAK